MAAASFSCRTSQKVSPDEISNKLGQNPHFIIDGKASDKSAMLTMDAEQVASVTAYFGKDAIKRYGAQAEDGAVEIETIAYSKEKYQQVFKGASTEYKIKLEALGSDSSFQYILNGKALTKNFEGILAGITPDLLKEIKLVNSEELRSRYGIGDKQVVVLISALPPKSLHKGKEQFNQ